MSAFTDTDYERVVRERDEALARVDSQRSQIAFYRTACTARFLPEGFGDDTMRELIKELTEERDEWRDKFHALNQTAGELCNACGWAFKIPGESCRCEVIKERDEARAEVREYREQLRKLPDANRIASQDAFRRGAEAMREACAAALMADGLVLSRERAAKVVRALPIPEEP